MLVLARVFPTFLTSVFEGLRFSKKTEEVWLFWSSLRGDSDLLRG